MFRSHGSWIAVSPNLDRKHGKGIIHPLMSDMYGLESLDLAGLDEKGKPAEQRLKDVKSAVGILIRSIKLMRGLRLIVRGWMRCSMVRHPTTPRN